MKALAELPVQRRIRIPKAATAELAARYRVRQEAEQRLADYVAGILAAKGISTDDFVGLDDVTSELILR